MVFAHDIETRGHAPFGRDQWRYADLVGRATEDAVRSNVAALLELLATVRVGSPEAGFPSVFGKTRSPGTTPGLRRDAFRRIGCLHARGARRHRGSRLRPHEGDRRFTRGCARNLRR
ncbi:hypothetical protein MOJ79_05350 [Calidifontimicrobium sp. SYSU G02091]|uniref:hypothetical protein n=1 Tax=Calidifontimicrobium sp. SYSU G02091 TaxID=2926421 RepID=UPI001F53D18F|nr:hypothetical protein [Calidifontimicrobium sp. SYSU G02091]MCI1191261.1 hypothetical protein [Calidifontimicrobium sp. SYSU G02091]